MKVALLTDSEAFAGTERHMLDLTQALRQAGIDAELACPPRGELAAMARSVGLPVYGLDSCGSKALTAIATLRAMLGSGQWDLVHAHNGRVALLAAIARRLAGRGQLVSTQHFIDPARTKRRGWRAKLAGLAHHWVERQTAGIIAISAGVKQAQIARDGTPAGKIHVVINGIQDPAEMPLRSPEDLRRDLNVSAAAPLIVSVCRLEPEKSVETLVQAMRNVVDGFPEALCLIGGSGTEEARIAAEIERLELKDSIRLLGHQKDPHSLMRAATVFVLPSRAEPFGLALVEAMALRCPCVAKRAGGPAEIIVDDEVSGLLVSPDDPGDLARALRRLLADPGLRERIGAGARARFQDKFTLGRMGREIAAVYTHVLA